MIGKYRNLVMFALVLGLVGSVSAANINWSNDAADSNSWCNRFNWDPNAAVPGTSDTAVLRNPERGPIVDCDAAVGSIDGPSNNQVMDIISGTLSTVGDWDWQDGNATINISGTAIVNIGGSFPAPKNDTGILNISGNPTVIIGGTMKTANDGGSSFELHMSGGYMNVGGEVKWGEDGGGLIEVGGGATFECGALNYEGRDGAPWSLTLDGGTITVDGQVTAPGDVGGAGNVTIDIDAGILECGSFDNNGYAYAMDINEGMFIIDGDHQVAMNADVIAGYITAFNGTEGVLVTYEGGKTIVKADYVQVKASASSPQNYSLSECPGLELSWTPGASAAATQGHDVYFGTDLDDVTNATSVAGLGVYQGRQDSNVYPESGTLTIELSTTYYWRIDETDGAEIWTGDVWQFTTSDGKASVVYPEDKKTAVALDVELAWASGCFALSHDVYFGTDFNDVNDATTATPIVFVQNQPGSTYSPGALDILTVYYWRIDEVTDSTKHKGNVWSFRTVSAIVDENMILWYELDEAGGSIVSDSSGYEHHGSGYDIGGEWEPNNGHVGGCLDFEADQHVLVPSNTLDSVTNAITLAVWLNGSPGQDEDDNMIVFDTGDLGGGDNKLRGIVPTDLPELAVYWRAGNDTNDLLLWDEATPSTWRDEWHHFAFVKDETAGTMKIYFDGIVAQSKTGAISSLTNVKNKTFKIGAQNSANSDYDGKMDDFRIYDKALTDAEVAGLFIGGDIQQPWGPTPFNGETEVNRDTILTWRSGQEILFHDVYLGTDLDAVTDANTAVPLGVYKGRQILDANSYNPGGLELGTTYYWRIDEVNDADANSPWSRIWTFTVANYIIIEDFESYNNIGNPILGTWSEYVNAYFELSVPGDPVHTGGDQSALFLYYNDFNYGEGYHSEAGRPLGGVDFTEAGVKSLGVYFYGNLLNDAGAGDEPYIGIDDGTTYAESRYTDTGDGEHLIADIQEEEWHEWNIPLSNFSGLTMTSIENIYIGIGESAVQGGLGEVFFDNIRLYPPKCVPELGPEWDFSGNCIVDLSDIGVMGDQWLRTDAVLTVEAPADNPVAHWELEDLGTVAFDSEGLNDGTLEGEYAWVTGNVGSGAVEFTGDGGRVRVPHAEELMPTELVSVTTWLHPTEEPDYSARVVVKGIDENDWEAYYIQFNDSSEVQWTIRDPNHNNNGTNSDSMGLNEWIHAAGTYDGDTVKLYVNGQLENQQSTGGVDILYDVNDLSIGNRSDNNATPFIGKVDDVRVYDYALNAAEVAYIATKSTGDPGTAYLPLVSAVNIYDEEAQGEKVVNFRDLAKFMTAWMEEQLWPE